MQEQHPNHIPNSATWVAVGAVVLIFVNIQAARGSLDAYTMGVLSIVGINIILAVSLNLINGVMGQLSIGHAGFMAVGAYTTALLSTMAGTPIYINIIVAGCMAGVAGFIIGLPTLRLRGDYLAIATLGFGEIVRVVLQNLTITGGSRGIGNIEWVDSFFLTQVVAIISVFLIWRIVNSATGRALTAIREDETAAETSGINVTRYKVLAFTIGSFFAGVAGALFAHRMTFISPNSFTFLLSVEVLVMVVLGGLGSITGSILSAGFLTAMPEFLRVIDEWRMVIYPAMLVIVMLFRPQGLLGNTEINVAEVKTAISKLLHRKPKSAPPVPAEMVLKKRQPSPNWDSTQQPVLEVEDLSVAFGGLKAVSGFRLSLEKGALHGLIGPNGAGKTTIFNMLTGMVYPDSGSVSFCGQRIDRLPPYQVAQHGVARTFQNIRLYKDLTALDNVKIAFHMSMGYGLGSAILHLPRFVQSEAEADKQADQFLEVFNLRENRLTVARNLPYGAQRRLEIARAMATSPQLLLLDEPAAGMNANETAALVDMIRWIRDQYNVTILLIEHDMSLVMKVCEQISVLDYGVTICEGSPAEVRANPKVIEAYLGEEVG